MFMHKESNNGIYHKNICHSSTETDELIRGWIDISLSNIETWFIDNCENFPLGALQSLICGSGAGLCAKVAVYPLDLTKKRLQVQGFGYGRVVTGKFRTYTGFVDCLRSIAVNEGILAMYKGLSASILKAVVTAGIHFSTYEQFCSLFRTIYKSHSR